MPVDSPRIEMHASGLLTDADYSARFAAQGGACAICGRTSPRWLAVDHDHETGDVRGLLCSPCNLGLGHFADDPEVMEKAARYLRGGR